MVARSLLGGVRWYQRYISPLSGPRCRYYPTCSSYAVTAIEKHGAIRGTRLAVWRLLRCNPWTDGGIDDVPEPVSRDTSR
nr:membrane protein insertion efficiency factor YidD [Sanguibacter gelidistatuariae]